MQIRSEQVAAFDGAAKATFLKQLAAHVRVHHASCIVRLPRGEFVVNAIPDAALHGIVQVGIQRASSYGIRWQSTQAAFVVAMLVVAPNFDQHALVRDLLRDDDIEPDYRMHTVLERLTSDDWNVIRQSYEVTAWGARRGG